MGFIAKIKKWFRRKEAPAPEPKPAPIIFKWPKIKFPKKDVPWRDIWPKPKPKPDKNKYKRLRQWILNWSEWDKKRSIRDQLAEKIDNWWAFDEIYQDDFIATVEETFA